MNKLYTKVSLYVLAALTSVSFVACSQEDLDNTSNGEVEMRTVTITASEAPVSRTSYEDNNNNLSVKWKEGDVIYVGKATNTKNSDISIDEEGSGFYPFTATKVNGNQATFTGSLPKTLTGKVLALYGKKENIKITADNKVKLNFQTQNWNNSKTETDIYSTHLSDYDFMSASAEYDGGDKLSFQFKHEGAVLRLSLSGLPANTQLSTLRLETTDGNKDFYSYVLIDADGTSVQETLYNYLSFNIANATTDDNGNVVLYRTVSPTTFNTNSINVSLSCSLDKGDYTYTKTLSGITALNAGSFYYTPDITLVEDNAIKGNGGQSNPYIIDNPEKLLEIASQINNGTIENGGNGKYFEISRDIDMSGYEWTPIGTSSNAFRGNIYGIENSEGCVKINNLQCTSDLPGFAGQVNAATIKNLNIHGTFIGTKENTGGIVSYSYGGTIENCTFNGSLKLSTSTATNNCYVGGIVGRINKSSTSHKNYVKNCTNNAEISVDNSNKSVYLGGIVGAANTIANVELEISYCSNYGKVTGAIGSKSGIVAYYPSTDGTLTISNYYLDENSEPNINTNGSIIRTFSNANKTTGTATVKIIPESGETVTLSTNGGQTQYPLN